MSLASLSGLPPHDSGFRTQHLAGGRSFHFDRPIKQVAIIGTGPSGLTAARHLREGGIQVRIFERNTGPGGTWIYSPSAGPHVSAPTPPPSTGDYVPSFPPPDAKLPYVVLLPPPTRTPTSENRDLCTANGTAGNGTLQEETDTNPTNTSHKAGQAKTSDGWTHIREEHCAPNPVYSNLRNNVPTALQGIKDFPWPPNTESSAAHATNLKYLQDYARRFGLDNPSVVSFNTRVEKASKASSNDSSRDERWTLLLKKVEDSPVGGLRMEWWEETFDGLVVASGHYTAPWLPQTPGIEELFERNSSNPGRVIHSKSYRNPSSYRGQNVLIVGCGTSGADLNRDLAPHVNKIYHSVRDAITGNDDYQRLRRLQRQAIPKANAEQVAEVRTFVPSHRPDDDSVGVVEMVDGRTLTDVNSVIFCTGYQISRPFLADLHLDDPSECFPSSLGAKGGHASNNSNPVDKDEVAFQASLRRNAAHPTKLVTDGRWIQNLHEDIFYIHDPSLAFIGVPVGTATFTFFEASRPSFQSIAVAYVFAGLAHLPDRGKMAELYEARLRHKGVGRDLHLMGEERELEYVRELVKSLNEQIDGAGLSPDLRVTGHTPEWIVLRQDFTRKVRSVLGLPEEEQAKTDV